MDDQIFDKNEEYDKIRPPSDEKSRGRRRKKITKLLQKLPINGNIEMQVN